MYFSSWLRNRTTTARANRAASLRQPPAAPRRSARRFRPRIEILEDRCVPSAGFLDPTFNTTGVVTAPVDGGGPYAVAIYAPGTANAGKIVSVGLGGLARFNPDGSLDATFGNGGIVNQSSWTGADVALVGDKILASGTALLNAKGRVDFEIARFNSDGSLDQTFGTNGTVLTAFGGKSRLSDSETSAMAVQADGKIVVAGIALVPINNENRVFEGFAVARYTPNGVLDTTFGNNGEMLIAVGPSVNPPDGLALSGNSIDLVGHSYSNIYVVQLTAAGQLDPNFGTGGVVNVGQGFAPSLTAQGDGKLVVVSYNASSPAGIHVTRLLANGSPETGFGTGGTATVPWSITGTFYSEAVKVDPLGRFVIGGYQPSYTDINFVVIRLTSAGGIIPSPI